MFSISCVVLGASLIILGLLVFGEALSLERTSRHIIEVRRDAPAMLENGALFSVPERLQIRMALLIGLLGVAFGAVICFIGIRR